MVLGLLGLTFCPGLGPFAWYQGSLALQEIDAAPSMYGNRGMVSVGRILGIAGTVYLLLYCGGVLVYGWLLSQVPA